jgi:hypothetical protein
VTKSEAKKTWQLVELHGCWWAYEGELPPPEAFNARPPTSPSDTRTLSFPCDRRGAASAASVWSRRRSSGQPLWCCTPASAMAMTEAQRTAFVLF